eukprot:NODE_479_length_2199_cov_29.733023_g441_i0.p1 GENE.NODE_479_length_2199_cov_29.733023_g441_i0~~NODE_479_length_2199_cov_29.733023_g441_i0.p1  ORF type:complete len:281 (+),score=49.03 NODE_479_length_2199_cov_29.733023_g441_i0:712-1554(+)
MSGQLCTYDVTLPVNDTYPDHHTVITHLTQWCKKWVFQQERGDPTDLNPDGYLHWQIRVSLIKKRRLAELVNRFCPGGHISPTTKGVHDGSTFNYVLKADSRVEGPWTDAEYEEPPVLTRQLANFNANPKRAYQVALEEIARTYDERSIHFVYDPVGNIGKSIFAEYLEYNKIAYEIPPFNDMMDIMACVMSIKTHKCYLVDMPRALKKDKLAQFFSGIECLKNGIAFDKRYSFKKRRFDRPNVIIFSNVKPCLHYLSPDRWVFHTVQPDYSLTTGPLAD